MASLLEDSDSDGEFPDLKDLLKGVKGRKGVSLKRDKDLASTSGIKSYEKEEERGSLGRSEEDVDGDVGKTVVAERSVKKKRVLGKRDDNPLLRPIAKSAREERVRNTSYTLFDADRETSRIKSVKAGKVGDGRAAVEINESTEELGVRMLKVKAMKQRLRRTAVENAQSSVEVEKYAFCLDEGSEELPELEALNSRTSRESSLMKMEIKGQVTKQQESKPVNGNNSRTAKSMKEPLGEEGQSEGLPGLDDLKMRKDRDASTESSATGMRLVIRTTKLTEPAMNAGIGRSRVKAAFITIDSDDENSIQAGDLEEINELKASKIRRRDLAPKTKSKYILTDTEEEDPSEDEDEDGMSDFIVSDHESIEGDDSVMEIPPPPPKSTRKLVRGRRRRMSEAENEDGLELEMGRLRVDDDDVFGDLGKASRENDIEECGSPVKPPTKSSRKAQQKETVSIKPPSRKEKEAPPPSSDIEDPFTLRFSPSENKRKVSKEIRFTTPPSSPKLKSRALPSPAKLPRIPSSPHRQSSDAFWSQDVVNDWNDEYSPRKTPKPTLKPLSSLGDGTLLFSRGKSPIKPDGLTKGAKKAFSQIKHELAESFLKELDEKITNGKIAEMAESTGGVKIIWSKKLNTTAGRANWKRETIRPKSTVPSATTSALTFRHHAAIELAEKVIDDQDRLFNVIAHEFCHLANFMVSNIKTNPHGKEFKAWAAKCSREFGDRGIAVTTKHSYEIDYKYVWECENCGTEFKRHSKSIDPTKHRCGVCKYKLVQTKPVPRAGADADKVISGYQKFVKENMKLVREENPGSPQKEIMGLVGKRYQEYKATKLRKTSVESVTVQEVVSKEGTPVDDGVGDVVRKLGFLDLTSP